LDILEQVHY